jgi:hypothetical protein
MDLGGAKDRPPLKEVWENVDAKPYIRPIQLRGSDCDTGEDLVYMSPSARSLAY